MLVKKIIKITSVAFFALCIVIFSFVAVFQNKTADSYYVQSGQSSDLRLSKNLKLYPDSITSSASSGEQSFTAGLKLFGIIPVKQVTVTSTARTQVTPGGIAFGIKMISNGVSAVSLNNFVSGNKIVCPAKQAGIRLGDSIISIDSKSVKSNDDVTDIVKSSGGKRLDIVVKRGDTQKKLSIKPELDSADGTYKIGLSVRDSNAGIGTVTFYDEKTSTFGGLGHAVCEAGETAVSLYSGSVAIASIDSVTASIKGSPGRLNGHFVSNIDSGTILLNDQTGVYGTLENVKCENGSVEVAFKQEIKKGKATIITTLSGTQPQEFEIEIEQIALNSDRQTKNMVVRVTDERLLEAAGGIVQGMSGSPILQNGRLVGAVSHVFVNDTTRGYAIFAENMLSSAQLITETVGDSAHDAPQNKAS